ncbi:MAG: hypothetical protein ACOC2W_00425 [bacterium]
MKVVKVDAELEIKLQKIEELMKNLNIKLISYGAEGLCINYNGNDYWIKSIENGEKTFSLPRFTEDERLVLWE